MTKKSLPTKGDENMATTTAKNGTPDSLLIQQFKAARRVSTPLVAIETPDMAATIVGIRKALPESAPVLSWDAARGLNGLNPLGKAAFGGLGLNPAMSVNAAETLLAMEKLPQNSLVFMLNFQRQFGETAVLQALWNLRDEFKLNKRTVVMLGPAFTLPAEIAGDVIVLVETLPTRAELSDVIDQQHKNAQLALPSDEVKAAALDAVVGLAHYTAEQVTAMSLTPNGVSVQSLWERKIKAIKNTQGLDVYQPQQGDTTLDELKGLDNVVAFAQKLIAAHSFNVIVFLDEMDKGFAGGMSDHTGDSGVAKDQVGQVLTYMVETKSRGMMFAGVAGSGKTQLAKAMSAASGKPLIILDLGGMKGGVVGESERNIRAALKVITATSEGKALFIGTANRTTMFTPELNRRFRDQFFFDTPDDSGRAAIWPVYVAKNKLVKSQAAIPQGFDAGWTGAEIQYVCERAAEFGESVIDAAKYLVPQSLSAKSVIAQMRRESTGRFLSASYEGHYIAPTEDEAVAAARTRSIEVN